MIFPRKFRNDLNIIKLADNSTMDALKSKPLNYNQDQPTDFLRSI